MYLPKLIQIVFIFYTALALMPSDLDYKNLRLKKKFFCRETKLNNMKWLSHKNFQRCVNIVSDIRVPRCFYRQLNRENIAYEQKSMAYMLNRNVVEKTNPLENLLESSCDTYMIITPHLQSVTKIFSNGQKHFYPFTRIFLLTPHNITVPPESLMYALNYGYNVYGLQNNYFVKRTFFNLDYGPLINLHTNKTMNSTDTDERVLNDFFGSYKTHPLFDRKITKNRPFRVSFMHCRPYVIVLDKEKKIFDGVEFRLISDIVRGWHVHYNVSHHNWNNILSALQNEETDIGLCSIWLSYDHIRKYDLSMYLDYQCITFLVPRPLQKSEAFFIYFSLQSDVWMYFLITMISIGVLLTLISRFNVFKHKRRLPYRNLLISFVEMINTATSHGIAIFPDQTPIKFIVVSWMLLCHYYGVFFSSGYVSILTSPPYEKPVNTIEEYVAGGLKWGDISKDQSMFHEFRQYDSPLYDALLDTRVRENSLVERMEHIESREYAYLTRIGGSNFVTDIPFRNRSVNLPLRVMKSCVNHYYSVFAFSLQSPYRDYFTDRISHYHENGLILHWYNIIAGVERPIMDHLFESGKQQEREASVHGLADLKGAFYLLLIGLALSLIVFCIELIWFKINSTKSPVEDEIPPFEWVD